LYISLKSSIVIDSSNKLVASVSISPVGNWIFIILNLSFSCFDANSFNFSLVIVFINEL